MAIRDDIKLCLRIGSDAYNGEIDMLAEAAREELRRVGVLESMLSESADEPQVRMAICTYAKAHFGYDNEDAARLDASFRQQAINLAISFPDEE